MMVKYALVFLVSMGLLAMACSGNDDDDGASTEDDNAPTVASDVEEATPTATEPPATSTPTVEPTPTPQPVGQSRQNPASIGTELTIGSWSMVVNSVTPDAAALIMAENQFNDPPDEGDQFFIANISATYVGDEEPSSLFSDTSISALGPSSVAYQDFDDTCGVIPDEADTFVDVFNGGTITGNLCWSVLSSDAAELVMFVEDDTNFDSDEIVWFSLSSQ